MFEVQGGRISTHKHPHCSKTLSGSLTGTCQTCTMDSHSYLDSASPFLSCFLTSAFCNFTDLAISRSLMALPWILSGSVFLIRPLGGRLRWGRELLPVTRSVKPVKQQRSLIHIYKSSSGLSPRAIQLGSPFSPPGLLEFISPIPNNGYSIWFAIQLCPWLQILTPPKTYRSASH